MISLINLGGGNLSSHNSQTRNYRGEKLRLARWFPNLSGHQNPLEGYLKHRLLALCQDFLMPYVWDDDNDVGLGTTLCKSGLEYIHKYFKCLYCQVIKNKIKRKATTGKTFTILD